MGMGTGMGMNMGMGFMPMPYGMNRKRVAEPDRRGGAGDDEAGQYGNGDGDRWTMNNIFGIRWPHP